jgi:glycosyltransferase involved in cell wall biosynthesis
MKKKILFLITKSNFGGAQRYVYELATSLPKERFTAVVAFGGTGKQGALVGTLNDMLEHASIRTVPIRYLARDINIIVEFRAFFEILALIKKEKPDILHINSSKAGGLGALAGRLRGVPRIIFTAHGWPHQEERPLYQKISIYFVSWFSVLLSHKTIVVSKKDAETAPALFARKRVVYIPNGIQKFDILSRDGARLEIKKAVGKNIPNDAPWIGTISELTKNKGLDVALAAVSKIERCIFIIIGAGEERGRLELMADELGIHERVYFAGFIPNARRLLKAFDIYTLTSRKEGLPYALLEAGAVGLPIVASNVGGIPDIIENTVSGLLTTKNVPADIEKQLQKMLTDIPHRNEFGKRIKERVERKFLFTEMLNSTIRVYANTR